MHLFIDSSSQVTWYMTINMYVDNMILMIKTMILKAHTIRIDSFEPAQRLLFRNKRVNVKNLSEI